MLTLTLLLIIIAVVTFGLHVYGKGPLWPTVALLLIIELLRLL